MSGTLHGKRVLVTQAGTSWAGAVRSPRRSWRDLIADVCRCRSRGCRSPGRRLGVVTCWSPISRFRRQARRGRGQRRRVRQTFAALVDPLPRLVRASSRHEGPRPRQILVIAAPRAARHAAGIVLQRRAGAQLAYVQAIGVELAPDNIQVNAIAQNFVDNPTTSRTMYSAIALQERLKREVPLGRLCRRRKTQSSPHICAAMPPTASSVRSFPSARLGCPLAPRRLNPGSWRG